MHLVWDGCPDQRNADESLLRVLDTLADRLGHLAGFAESGPDHAVAVTDDDDRAEAEPTTALHHLGDAVDLDDLLLERELRCVDLCHMRVSPRSLEVEAALAGALRERADPPVILIPAAIEDDAFD